MTTETKMLGTTEITLDGTEERCSNCRGVIPDPVYWPELGETNGGYCPGRVRPDGFCGAFCELE